MDSLVSYKGENKNKKNKFDFKKHKDNTLRSLNEVENFLNCTTKVKNYACLFKLFR